MKQPDKLYILWTNADVLTAEKMVFMYAGNSLKRDWWKEVELIIWGATAKLCAENEDIQAGLAELMRLGVRVVACRACASALGVQEKLESLGIEVFSYGQPLTELIREKENLITV